jgi:hypothetical protein
MEIPVDVLDNLIEAYADEDIIYYSDTRQIINHNIIVDWLSSKIEEIDCFNSCFEINEIDIYE